MTERFSPLIGIDATWNIKGQGLITKFEFKNVDRNTEYILSVSDICDDKYETNIKTGSIIIN